jgi:hypothetical protein
VKYKVTWRVLGKINWRYFKLFRTVKHAKIFAVWQNKHAYTTHVKVSKIQKEK